MKITSNKSQRIIFTLFMIISLGYIAREIILIKQKIDLIQDQRAKYQEQYAKNVKEVEWRNPFYYIY